MFELPKLLHAMTTTKIVELLRYQCTIVSLSRDSYLVQ